MRFAWLMTKLPTRRGRLPWTEVLKISRLRNKWSMQRLQGLQSFKSFERSGHVTHRLGRRTKAFGTRPFNRTWLASRAARVFDLGVILGLGTAPIQRTLLLGVARPSDWKQEHEVEGCKLQVDHRKHLLCSLSGGTQSKGSDLWRASALHRHSPTNATLHVWQHASSTLLEHTVITVNRATLG